MIFMTKTVTTNPSLWDFATAFYAKPNVQSACLILQNTAGVNVPLLLSCCWVGKYYGELPSSLATQVSQFAADYSKLSTEPLREIRIKMKHSYNPQWPIEGDDWQALREQVKVIELYSEKLLLQGLEQLLIDKADCLLEQNKGQVIKACGKNIRDCLGSLNQHQDIVQRVLNSL